MIALDCSVAISWMFEDEKTKFSEKVLESLVDGEQAVVPALWPLEIANVLLISERRKRLGPDDPAKCWEMLQKLSIEVETFSSLQTGRTAFVLARSYGLSSYDASYLELAMRREIPIATLDKNLAKAARSANIKVLN